MTTTGLKPRAALPRHARWASAVAISLLAPSAVRGAETSDIAGQYICASGCRMTDAPPGIEINGTVATCMDELGGIFTGSALPHNAVACFNMVGTLSADGREVLWSNGNRWKRR